MEKVKIATNEQIQKLGALIPAQEAYFQKVKPLISELYEIITSDDAVEITGEAPSVHSFIMSLEALNGQDQMDQLTMSRVNEIASFEELSGNERVHEITDALFLFTDAMITDQHQIIMEAVR